MVTNQADTIKKVQDYLTLVGEIFAIDSAWLYGSYSRNKQKEWSDIDVAICSQDFEYIPRPIAIKILSKIAKKIDFAIEPYPLRPLECKEKITGTMAEEIISSGVRLI